MPYFKWRGVNMVGQWCTGKQFAPSPEQLDADLFKKQISLVASKPIKTRLFVRPIALRDTAEFFRHFAVLVQAGILVPQALVIAGSQLSNPRLQEIVYAMADDVQSGKTLSESLCNYPRVFSPIMVQLIQSGEQSGKLAPALLALCDHLESTNDLYAQIRSALMMPVITFAFFCIIVGVIFTVILPRFAQIFASMKADIPPLTQNLLAISAFMRSFYMIVLVVGMVLCVVLVTLFNRTRMGKKSLDQLLLKIPFVGSLLRYRFSAYFFHSLGMLLHGGMQLVPALAVIRESIHNAVFASEVAMIQHRIDSGDALSDALHEADGSLFAPDAVAMVMVGQESSALPTVLQKIAQAHKQRIHSQLKTATALIQPLLMLLLGLFVALLIFAIYTPLFNLSHSVRM